MTDDDATPELIHELHLLDGSTVTVDEIVERHYKVWRDGQLLATRKTEKGAIDAAARSAAKYDAAYQLAQRLR